VEKYDLYAHKKRDLDGVVHVEVGVKARIGGALRERWKSGTSHLNN